MITPLLLSLALLANFDSVSAQTKIKGKAFDRLAIIWLENTDYDLAAGDPNLAWLAKKGISLTNYFGVTHPSMPNYAASISGDYYGINHDDMVAIPSNVSTLVDLLEDKGISWAEYQEDMPSVGFQGKSYTNPKTGANMYVRKHNPAVLYDSNAQKSDRLAKIKPLNMFNDDLAKNALPQWMFITPNMTSDGAYSLLPLSLSLSLSSFPISSPVPKQPKYNKLTLRKQQDTTAPSPLLEPGPAHSSPPSSPTPPL